MVCTRGAGVRELSDYVAPDVGPDLLNTAGEEREPMDAVAVYASVAELVVAGAFGGNDDQGPGGKLGDPPSEWLVVP